MLVCPNTFHIGEYKTRVADCKPFCLGSGANIYWQNPEAIEMNCLMVCCVKCLPGWPLEEPWPLKGEATLRSEHGSIQTCSQLWGSTFWTLQTPTDLNQSSTKSFVLKKTTDLSELFISLEGFLLRQTSA